MRQSIDPALDELYFPDRQPDRTPQLGWVFFRKYSPDADRKSLKLHVDSNMHTLNIALNDDFEGGGLLYVRPPALQMEADSDGRPDIPDEYKNYDWLNAIKRENTSDVVFPTLGEGDVLVHNFTVWHAVAPVEAGTRYSFVLFYDMDNPAIREDFPEGHPWKGGGAEEEGVFTVFFVNEVEDAEIDLVWVEEREGGDEVLHVVEEKMPAKERVGVDTMEGHVFLALVSGTDAVVSRFVMDEEQELYTIASKNAPGTEEL